MYGDIDIGRLGEAWRSHRDKYGHQGKSRDILHEGTLLFWSRHV
jgi:hypothetical protein